MLRTLPHGNTSFGFTLTGNEDNENFNLTDETAGEDKDESETFSLKPGTYTVAEDDYSGGWKTTYRCTGGQEIEGRTIDNIVLEAGKSLTCTFTNTKYGSISGYKYEDANGIIDEPENTDITGVSGWTITLKDEDGIEIDSTTTNASGYYKFTKLLPGKYTVTEGFRLDGWVWSAIVRV